MSHALPAPFEVAVTLVRKVASHQSCPAQASVVVEEDISGEYIELSNKTLYCAERSMFVQLNHAQHVHVKAGYPIRVSTTQVS